MRARGIIISVFLVLVLVCPAFARSGWEGDWASDVQTDTIPFDGILSAADDDVQKALETIDAYSPDLTGHVPYTGATTNVDLGIHNITTTGTITSSTINLTNASAQISFNGDATLAYNDATDTLYSANDSGGLPNFSSGAITVIQAPYDNITLSGGVVTATSLTDGTATLTGGNLTTTGLATLGSIKSGILYPSADSTTAVGIFKADGTTNVLNVDTTNGRVGIGTTSPSNKLSVSGNADFTGNVGFGVSNPDGRLHLASLDYKDIFILERTNPAHAAKWEVGLANGRWNMGPYPQSTSNNRKFLVDTDGKISLGVKPAEASWGGIANSLFVGGRLSIGNGILTHDNPQKALEVYGDSYISGNVGIGTTSPTEKLEIDGNLFLNGDNDKILLGAGKDASISYDGTNVVINPKEVGAGYLDVVGTVKSDALLIGNSALLSSFRTVSGRSPASPYSQVLGTATDTGIGIARFTNTQYSGNFYFAKSRGATVGSYAVVQNNDSIGQFVFEGSDGTDFAAGASFGAYVDGTPGNNDMPGKLVFSTSPDSTQAPVGRMTIKSNGNVGIGTTEPGAKLEVKGNIQLTSDNDILKFGTGEDASIYYDATNFIINPKVAGSGYLNVKGQILVDDKILFTQTDGNEYIDSLNDGYLDLGATTAIRLKQDTTLDADKDLVLSGTGYVDSPTYKAGGTAPVADATYAVYNDGVTSGQVTSITTKGGIITGIAVVP
jgi:hypothetical protein